MTKLILLLCAAAFSLNAQVIAWSKVWTSPNTGTFGAYINGYHDIHYDPFTQKTWVYSTDTTNTGDGIYSIRLHYFDSTTNTDTVIGDNGQPSATSTGCFSTQTSPFVWPFSHHEVGQGFVDQIRHRFFSYQGTSCADTGVDQWYYQLLSPPDTHKSWIEMQPPHSPIANSQNSIRSTTLNGALLSADTSMTLTAPAGFGNNEYVKVDSEIIKITAGGGTHGYQVGNGTAGTNPFTILRAQYGTTAASHLSGATVVQQEGEFNNGSIVHDTDDDVFFLLGLPQTGADEFWVYCDTSINPTPGTLTSFQTGAGCSRADDWTSISSKSICTDSHCVAIVSGTNGPNSGKVPPGTYYPNLEYDSVHHQLIQWAGSHGSGSLQNLTFSYNPSTFTWTNLAPSCTGADCVSGAPLPQSSNSEDFRMTHAIANGKYYYHLTRRPSSTTGAPQDWVLDPSVPSWTEVQTGQGPNYSETMTYDSGCGCLIAWGATTQGQSLAEIWTGKIGGSGGGTPPSITTGTTLSGGTQFAAYSTTLVATGTTPTSWGLTSGVLPAGLSLNTSTGLINGTSTQAGVFSFTILASNTAGTDSKIFSLTITSNPTLSLNLTIQEALYPGSTTGIARTNEPFCQGVPIADSAAISSLNNFTLTGASAGQFRVLGNWPDGNIKWIEACGILPGLSAGSTATVTLSNGGAGNFGGSNLALDNGPTITVATGTSTFTIKKANFNVLDSVVVGSTTIVASSTSGTRGLVVLGPSSTAPYPANVTCGTGTGQTPCTNVFSSANDPNSTCFIEKNGPVTAVLNCTGSHLDSSSNTYMHFTVREYFYANQNRVKLTVALRNADKGPSNTFATAFKGHQGYELRLDPNLTGTLTYNIGVDPASKCAGSSPGLCTGTLNQSGGTDSVYLYQGESQLMKWQDWCGSGCVPYTTDTGYTVNNNGTALLTKGDTFYPAGWADIQDSSGNGMEIGVYQLSAYWPKSLEFNGGGTDARIGIWARENSQPYYQEWPQYNTHDLYLNFHNAALTSPGNEFLKFQHGLLARAPYTYYNSTAVFPYQMIDPTVENSFYSSIESGATTPTPSGSSVVTSITNTNPTTLTLANSTFAAGLIVGQSLQVSGATGSGCSLLNSVHIVSAISGNQITITQMPTPSSGGAVLDATSCTYTASSATANALPALQSTSANCQDSTGHCDFGTNNSTWSLPVFRFYAWHSGGGGNQSEFRWSYLMNFITRGMTGRYLFSSHFYRFLGDSAWPRADGFTWRSQTSAIDSFGRPTATSANASLGMGQSGHANWLDQEHGHWYGMPDYYFISGDESIKDAIMDGPNNYFQTQATYQNGEFLGFGSYVNVTSAGVATYASTGSTFVPEMALGPVFVNHVLYNIRYVDSTHFTIVSDAKTGAAYTAGAQTFVPVSAYGGVGNSRSVGVNLKGAARLATFLNAVGDSTEATAALATGENDYRTQVAGQLCASGFPSGCTVGGTPTTSGNWRTEGVSRTRGMHMGGLSTYLTPWCQNNSNQVRFADPFQADNLIEGILEFRNAKGSSWSEYWNSLDLAYGVSRWALSEMYVDTGNNRWDVNGFRYYEALDLPGSCNGSTGLPDYHVQPQAQQTVAFTFLPKYLVDGSTAWAQKFKMNMSRLYSALGFNTSSPASDFLSYQISDIIGILNNPGTATLNPVPISGFTDNGGGSYTLSWTGNPSAQYYRVKWASLPVVDWIGFDPVNNVFTGDPVHNAAWFSATNATGIPAPGAGTQSMTINTGTAGLTAANFSVKAFGPVSSSPLFGTTLGHAVLGGNVAIR